MVTRKYRKRRKRPASSDATLTVALQPGEVPSDSELDAEAAAIDDEIDGKYELAKHDDLSLAALRKMTSEELAKIAK